MEKNGLSLCMVQYRESAGYGSFVPAAFQGHVHVIETNTSMDPEPIGYDFLLTFYGNYGLIL